MPRPSSRLDTNDRRRIMDWVELDREIALEQAEIMRGVLDSCSKDLRLSGSKALMKAVRDLLGVAASKTVHEADDTSKTGWTGLLNAESGSGMGEAAVLAALEEELEAGQQELVRLKEGLDTVLAEAPGEMKERAATRLAQLREELKGVKEKIEEALNGLAAKIQRIAGDGAAGPEEIAAVMEEARSEMEGCLHAVSTVRDNLAEANETLDELRRTEAERAGKEV